MVKKVMNAKIIVDQVQQVQNKGKGVLRQIYYHMKGVEQMPAWTCLMYSNAARPKAYITMWIMMNQKLTTVDRLTQWGIEVDKMSICEEAAGESFGKDRSPRYCSIGLGAVSAMVYSTWEGKKISNTNVQDSVDKRYIWFMDREKQ
ncbi:hypothetical protein EJD97_001598 [Solanum chilense]|uniref:Reverse transcriptase zinc-binding domain-containing protein n=1 Tax=Solanum chilense TaxID=4083 RepID=A0A6N2C102_SOLCI|nr:hypothetical protein EJD97_001598 [Solanum chilense]